jgi:hypothetical protein
MTGGIPLSGKNASEWNSKCDGRRDPPGSGRPIRHVDSNPRTRRAETTVSEFLARWDRDWASSKVESKTIERYRELPHNGAIQIQRLHPVHLNELYAKLLREGGKGGRPLSPRTVGHVHRLIHCAFGSAAMWGVVLENVASLAKPPKAPKTELKILTEDQV